MDKKPQKPLAPLQETLINCLKELNSSDHLSYLIEKLEERELENEAKIFIFISLCIYCYPEIINHPQRQDLENLYKNCFLQTDDDQLSYILGISSNKPVKALLDNYIKYLTRIYSNEKTTNTESIQASESFMLDDLARHIIENYEADQPEQTPNLVLYLLNDFARFIADHKKLEANMPTPSKKQ